MDLSELNNAKLSSEAKNVTQDAALLPQTTGTASKNIAPINVSAAYSYLSVITSEGTLINNDEFSLAQSTLQRHIASLAQDPQRAANASSAPEQKPLMELISKLLVRDIELQDEIAHNFTSRIEIVKTADAVDTLKSYCDTLPKVFQESNEPGKALMRYLCEIIVNRSTADNISPAMTRQLALHQIFAPDIALTSKEAMVLDKLLGATIEFIRANQPDVLSSLGRESAQVLSANSTREEMANFIIDALGDSVDDSTYLDIFTKNSDKFLDEQSAVIAKKVEEIITRAANTARDANLLDDSSPGVTPISKEDPTDNAKESTLAPMDITVRELNKRSSDIQKQLNDDTISKEESNNLKEQTIEELANKIRNSLNNEANTKVIDNKDPASLPQTQETPKTSENLAVTREKEPFLRDAVVKTMKEALQNDEQSSSKINAQDKGNIDLLDEYEHFSLPKAQVQGEPLTKGDEERIKYILSNAVAQVKDSHILDSDEALSNADVNVNDILIKNEVTKALDELKTNTDANLAQEDMKVTPKVDTLLSDIEAQEDSLSDELLKLSDIAKEYNLGNSPANAANISDDMVLPQDSMKVGGLNPKNVVTSSTGISVNDASELVEENKSLEVNSKVFTTVKTSLELKDPIVTDDNIEAPKESLVKINAASLEKSASLKMPEVGNLATSQDDALQGANTSLNLQDKALKTANLGLNQVSQPIDAANSKNVADSAVKNEVTNDTLASRHTPYNSYSWSNSIIKHKEAVANIEPQDAQNTDSRLVTITSNDLDDDALLPNKLVAASDDLDLAPKEVAQKSSFLQKLMGFLGKKEANLQDVSSAVVNSQVNNEPREIQSKVMPMEDMISTLGRIINDGKITPEIREMARNIQQAMTTPIGDLQSVAEWLGFVSAPMSASGPRAEAMQQWALLLLSIRFRQIGKTIDKFTKTDQFKKLIQNVQIGDDKSWPQNSLNQTLQQIERLQSNNQASPYPIPSYIPLPPSYEQGKEGALMIEHKKHEDGEIEWKLNFFFDLQDLGAMQVKTFIKFPEIKLAVVTEKLDALQRVKATIGHLSTRFADYGLNVANVATRMGTVYPPKSVSSSTKSDTYDGLSLKI